MSAIGALVVAAVTAGAAVSWSLVGGPTFWRDLSHPLPPPSASEQFVILVADLANDDDGRTETARFTRALLDVFEPLGADSPIRIIRLPRTLRVQGAGDAQEAQAQTEQVGRSLMQRQNGDILIWGTVERSTAEVHLQILRQSSSQSGLITGIREFSYRTEVASLVAPSVAAILASEAAPAFDRESLAVETLRSIKDRIGRLVLAEPNPLRGNDRARVLGAYAAIVTQLGDLTSDKSLLRDAITMLSLATQECDERDLQLLAWLSMRGGIAGILLSNLDASPEGDRLAAGLLSTSVELYAQLRDRQNWAAAQGNLGVALMSLAGEEAPDQQLLGRAIAAFEAAQTVYSREADPVAWATIRMNLSSASLLRARGMTDHQAMMRAIADAAQMSGDAAKIFYDRGMRRSAADALNNAGTAFLEFCFQADVPRAQHMAADSARESFELALQIYRREREPQDWAMATFNLAVASAELARTEPNYEIAQPRYEQALELHARALEVYSREQAPELWARSQHMLGMALWYYGRSEPEVARSLVLLDQAVVAFESEREVHSLAANPVQWALATANLGEISATRGAKTNDNQFRRDAIARFREAQSILEREHATAAAPDLTDDIASVQGQIAE